MNCQAIQNKILTLPDPRRVPDSLRDHVAECAGCRMWAEQAGRLESLLERLPVPPPPADKKTAVVEKLHREPTLAEPAVATREEGDSSFRRFLRENGALVGGLAAAVLVAFAAWWVYPGTGPKPDMAATTPEYPLLKNVTQRQVALANADTPAKKLRALGGLADDLSAEARGLARVASADELQDIARWYGQVKENLVEQAQNISPQVMTPKDKQDEFNALAAKLGETAAEVEKIAAEVSPDAKPALQHIVASARDGEKKFRTLAEK